MNLSIETRDFWATKGIDITEDHQCIHVISQRPLRTISSGIHGGGMRDLQHIVNFHVPETYDCADPKADLYTKIKGIGIDTTVTTGLMTAALLEDAGFAHVTTDDACLFAIVTAGFSNAARVGSQVSHDWHPGTINTMVVVDGFMTPEALVEAVITVTEAKAAALADLHVYCKNGLVATGTTTDAVAIGATQSVKSSMTPIEYTGLATAFGEQLAKTVYQACYETGQKYIEKIKNIIEY